MATLLLSGGFKNGTSQAPARSLHGLTATIAIIGCALNADIGSWLDMTAWRRRDAEIERARVYSSRAPTESVRWRSDAPEGASLPPAKPHPWPPEGVRGPIARCVPVSRPPAYSRLA